MTDWMIAAAITVLSIVLVICLIHRNRGRGQCTNDNTTAAQVSKTARIPNSTIDSAQIAYEVARESRDICHIDLASTEQRTEHLSEHSAAVERQERSVTTNTLRLHFTRIRREEFNITQLFEDAYLRNLVFHCDDCGRSLTKCLVCGWSTCEYCHDGICDLCGNSLYLDSTRKDFARDSYSKVRLVPPSDDYGDIIKENDPDDHEDEEDHLFGLEDTVDYLDEELEIAAGQFCDECGRLMTGTCEFCGSCYCDDDDCRFDDRCYACGESLRNEGHYDSDLFWDYDLRHSDNPYAVEFYSAVTGKADDARMPVSSVAGTRKTRSTTAKEKKSTNAARGAAKRAVTKGNKARVGGASSEDITESELSAFIEDRETVLDNSRFVRLARKPSESSVHDNEEVIIVNSRWRIEQNKRRHASSFFKRQGLTFDTSEWFRWDPRTHYATQQKKRTLKGYEIFENSFFEKIVRYRTTLGQCACPDFVKRGKPCKHMYCIAIIEDLGLPISYDDYKNNLYANIW